MNREAITLDEPALVHRAEMLPQPGSIREHVLAHVAAKAREIAAFVLRQKNHKVFAENNDPRRVFRYIVFHVLHGNVFVVRDQARAIIGVGFAWPERAREVIERDAMGEEQFAWRAPVESSDAIMIWQVMGSRRAAYGWRAAALQRWPDLHARRIFTHRNGKLVELDYRMLKRFAERQHGQE